MILASGLIAGGYFFIFSQDKKQARINNSTIEIEVADTSEERSKGLSGRESLSKNRGLLFIYPEPDFYGIWMKDMKFSIDVIWFDENYRVIDIVQGVRPESFPKTFKPPAPAKYVLEVNAGFTSEYEIKIGDTLRSP